MCFGFVGLNLFDVAYAILVILAFVFMNVYNSVDVVLFDLFFMLLFKIDLYFVNLRFDFVCFGL